MQFDHLPDTPAWQALLQHRRSIASLHMRELFEQDKARFKRYSITAAGLTLDYSKNLITDETRTLLLALAEEAGLKQKIQHLFAGEPINVSEQRAALHMALRAPATHPFWLNGENVTETVQDALAHMEQLVTAIHDKERTLPGGTPITDVVHLGIGGSFLGPKLLTEALKPFHRDVRVHYVANIDAASLLGKLNQLNPHSTLFIVASKSFGTAETLHNARTVKKWLEGYGIPASHIGEHFIAITACADKAVAFGIAPTDILPMWDWVGGRFSVWSTIGLPLALAIGMTRFRELLAGAWHMDAHFSSSPLITNMPVMLALINLWYINFYGADSRAILPYDHNLRALPAHLQQLEMESNGKCVTLSGERVNYRTGSIIWGGEGANGQHAFHQLLHQGTHVLPVDFVQPAQPLHPLLDHHEVLFANGLSQSQALMRGKTQQEVEQELRQGGADESTITRLAPQKTIPGNRPSNTIVYDQSTPERLGALIALYEHKVFVNSVIWDINPFDQWGVELGKRLSQDVQQALQNGYHDQDFDSSTCGLIDFYRRHNTGSRT